MAKWFARFGLARKMRLCKAQTVVNNQRVLWSQTLNPKPETAGSNHSFKVAKRRIRGLGLRAKGLKGGT